MQLDSSLNLLRQKSAQGQTLEKSASSRSDIRSLQILLWALGFGRELNWEKYRADGDYGGSTTKALQTFLKRNELEGDGSSVDASMVELMLDRYEMLPDLHQLKTHLDNGDLDKVYVASKVDSEEMAGLARILISLEFGSGLGKDALIGAANFAKKHNLAAEADTLTSEVASFLIEKISGWYGDAWIEAAAAAQNPDEQVEFKAISAKVLRAEDLLTRVNFRKHQLGVYTFGGETPPDFIEKNREALQGIGLTDSAIRVMIPVSGNEGNLDAVNTWDDSFMTFGMFQWTLGRGNGKGELPALMARLKNAFPEVFQTYFGKFGVDIAESSQTTGRLSLEGKTIASASEKETFRDLDWAFRFWKAGLDPQVQLIQVGHAFSRIYSFVHHKHYRPQNHFYIDQLITSEYGMCLLLDHHVNRPGHLMIESIGKFDVLGQALEHARLDQSDPSRWGTEEEMRLIDAYLPLRYGSSMTHSRERAAKIQDYVDRRLLSAERGSFDLGKTRSADGQFSYPGNLKEEDFPSLDPQEYEWRGVWEEDELRD